MRLGVWFAALTAGTIFGALQLGGWGLLLLYPATTLAACATGYLGAGAIVFGKRHDGSRAWWATLLMAPYVLTAWAIWRALRFVRQEHCCDALLPNVIIGRRLLPQELPDQVTVVIDLTAEMWEATGVRANRKYLARPILDGHVPTDAALIALTREIDALNGCVYIHCAEGRGRTGVNLAAGRPWTSACGSRARDSSPGTR